MDAPWINPLQDRLSEGIAQAAQWQGALGLCAALLGTWLTAGSGGRVVDAMLLRAGRTPRWRLTPCWFMGLIAGLCAPGRGHRDADAVGLASTGHATSLGASWFGLGAAGGMGLLSMALLLPSSHPVTAPCLVGLFAAGGMLALRERQSTWGALGGLVAGWCALVLGALLMARELDSLAGIADLAPWSRLVDVVVWLGVGCCLQVFGVPRGLVLVLLPALVYGGVLPLHTAMATTAGAHIGRAVSLFFSDFASGRRAWRTMWLLQCQALLSALVAFGLTAAGLRYVVGTPWADTHSLECLVGLETISIFVSSIVWVLLGYPIGRRLRRVGDPVEEPDHRAVQRPSIVVLGAIRHALQMGDLVLELCTQVLVPYAHRSMAGAVHSLRPASDLVRQSEQLRDSLENLVAQVSPWERTEEQSQLLAAALRCADERFALIEDLADPSLEPSRHQPTPSKALVPYFDNDLVERARLLKLSLADRGPWAPLDQDSIDALDTSLHQLRGYIGYELGESTLDPGMHTRLSAQLDARREFSDRCVRASESPLPRLSPSDDGLLQQSYELHLGLEAGDTAFLDRVDDRAA